MAFFARLRWCVQESFPPMKAGQPVVADTVIEVVLVVGVAAALVPVTVSVNGPAGTEQANAMLKMDVAEPPAETLTGFELKVRVTPATVELVRATEPENPLMLVTVMVDVPLVPVAMERDDGLELTLKLGGLTVIVLDVPELPA
jgi:hypothetical protein